MSIVFPSALIRFLDALRCPICSSDLAPAPGALRCSRCHTFNLARQGYVSLFSGKRPTSGDDVAMVRARDRFLRTGAYEPIREVIAGMIARVLPKGGSVLDAACGTGYYLAGVLDASPGAHGLGLDSSVPALRSAARAHERAAAASWNAFHSFPLADHTVDVVMDIFAPRNPAEFTRVLTPNGRLIVVRPTAQHLNELRDEVPGVIGIDDSKEQRLHDALAPYFQQESEEHVCFTVALEAQAARDLLGMTPSAHHITQASIAENNNLPRWATVSVLASSYRKRRSC